MTTDLAHVTLRWTDPANAAALWRELRLGLPEPAAVFGPEHVETRPRLGEAYFLGEVAGGHVVGLAWFRYPSPGTVAFGMGLFEPWRGRGLGVPFRDAIYTHVFTHPEVHKLESEVYTSNRRSIAVLHEKYPRAREEGRQRETISVGGVYHDRVLYGLTRDEWRARERQ